MWHPFDLIPEKLAVPEPLRGARCAGERSLAFQELALTYFRDKSSRTDQWPVMMEALPGLTLTRRGSADFELEVRHTWKLDYVRTLTGSMQCAGPWIAPRQWSFRRTFTPTFRGATDIAAVDIEGHWQQGELVQTDSGARHRQHRREPCPRLISIYALMAGFPLDAEWPQTPPALLGEDLVVARGARLLRSPEEVQSHPLAAGLQGYVVDVKGNFPTEFWVNAHGLVVYVFHGVGKAFVLTAVENAG